MKYANIAIYLFNYYLYLMIYKEKTRNKCVFHRLLFVVTDCYSNIQ